MNFACVCPGYFPLLGTIKTNELQSKHTGYIHSVKIDTNHPYKPIAPKGAPCSLWAWVVYKRWMKEYSHKFQLQHLIPLQEAIYVNFINYILSYIFCYVKLHFCNKISVLLKISQYSFTKYKICAIIYMLYYTHYNGLSIFIRCEVYAN